MQPPGDSLDTAALKPSAAKATVPIVLIHEKALWGIADSLDVQLGARYGLDLWLKRLFFDVSHCFCYDFFYLHLRIVDFGQCRSVTIEGLFNLERLIISDIEIAEHDDRFFFKRT
jgi:hypothetical protein